jgi:hypothetical protein
VPLRKLTIEINLPASATGQRAKEEHARLLRGILYLLETPAWAAFTTHLYDSGGAPVGRATLQTGVTTNKKELPTHGDSEQIAA